MRSASTFSRTTTRSTLSTAALSVSIRSPRSTSRKSSTQKDRADNRQESRCSGTHPVAKDASRAGDVELPLVNGLFMPRNKRDACRKSSESLGPPHSLCSECHEGRKRCSEAQVPSFNVAWPAEWEQIGTSSLERFVLSSE